MQQEMVPAANAVGKEAGEAIAKGVEEGAKAAATEASATIRAGVVGGAEAAAAQAKAILASGMTGGFAKQLATEMKAAEDAVVSSSLKMQSANNAASKASGEVLVAETRLAEARAKYADDSSQVVAAETRLADAEAKSALAADASKTATETNMAAKERYAASTKAVVAAEEAGTLKTAEAEAAQSKFNNTLNSTVPGLEKATSSYAKMGAGIVAAVVVGLGVHAVKAAADFQSSQERLVTTAGELQSNLAMVGAGVLKMAGDVGYSAQELSTGLYTVESAGYHGADALKVMSAAAQGAKTENADLTTVTDAVTSAMQDYHLSADQAGIVTSKMITAVGDGKTTFQDLTGAMSAVLPIASSLHIPMEEVLGDLSSMTLHGMSADQASQNLANAMRSLANPTLASTKELSALGLSAADLSKNLGTTGVQGTMEQISQAILQKMGPAGTTLLNSFNQSKQAAADAATMFTSLPSSLQNLAKGFQDGSITLKDWRTDLKKLPPEQANLLTQWSTMQKSASGFSDALKSGGNASQTYTQALAKATGNSTSMNVALMLTGENAAKTKQNINDIAKATTEAGGNVKGWSEVQGTFNQKLDEFKSGVGAVFIQLGTKLLPAVTDIIGGMMSFGHWISDNRTWLGLIVVTVGTFVSVLGAYKLVVGTVKLVTELWTAAQLALDAALDDNVIGLVVLAIAALVAGVIYAWTHFAAFRQVVEAVWNALKAAAQWVAGAAVAAWRGLVVAFNAVVTAAKAIGSAFVWLWDTILKPIFNVISTIVRVVAAIIITVFITPIYLLIKNVLAPVFTWLWENVLKPVFGFIGDIFTWLWNTIIKVVVGLIKAEIKAFGDIIQWVWDNVIHPVLNALGAAWQWFYDHVIKPVVAGIKVEIKAFGDLISWVWQNVIKPVIDALGAAWNWVYDHVFKPVGEAVNKVWNAMGAAIKWVWENIIKPAFDAVSTAVHAVGTAFDKAVSFIEQMWNKVKAVVATPINFVIDTVLNHGLFSVWNFIQDKLGLNLHIDNLPLVKFAGGGVLPGYAPGVDSIHAMLSPGEAILTPDAAKAVGHDNILALNSMYAPGHAYAGGGIVNPLQSSESGGMHHAFLGGIFDWVPGAASAVGGFVGNVASSIGDVVAHPIDAVKKLLNQVMSTAGSIANGSDLGKLLTGFPTKIIGGLVDKVTSWFNSQQSAGMTGGAGVIPTGQHLAMIDAALSADGINKADWPRWEAGMNTLVQRESGWNSSAVNNWDSNAKAGHPSGGLAQVIGPTFASNRNPSLPNNLLDPVANLAAAINYITRRYGDISKVQQANASMPPKGYDSGGWLAPGITQVVNASGHPEPVFSHNQWDVLKKNIGHGSRGGDTNYHITSHDPTSVVREIERKEKHNLAIKLS